MPLTEEQVRQKWEPTTKKARWKRLKERQRKIESSKRWKYMNSGWNEKAGFVLTYEDKIMKRDWDKIVDALAEMVPPREAV